MAMLFLVSCTIYTETYTVRDNSFEIWSETKIFQRWIDWGSIFVSIDWYWYKKEDWFDVWKKVKYCVE